MAIEGVVGVKGVWLNHESWKLIFSVPQGVNQNDSMQDNAPGLDSLFRCFTYKYNKRDCWPFLVQK